MVSFCTSHTIRGSSPSEVRACLGDRSAFVSTPEGPITVVLDAACESQDTRELSSLGATLSEKPACPVLAPMNHDDDQN